MPVVSAPLPSSGDYRSAGRRPSVVVVDDDPDIRELVEIRLGFDGYAVECFSTAEKGLAACLERRPDVLLLDVVLPGMSGIEALQHLRASTELADLPTVMLTALAWPEDADAALAAGASAYVVKPFSPRALTRVIADLVG